MLFDLLPCLSRIAPPPQVPREQDYLAVLHITPLRASRPLALRYLAQRVGRPLEHWVVLALAPETVGSADGGDLVAGSYCSDTSDLLGGLQKVCLEGAWLGRRVEGGRRDGHVLLVPPAYHHSRRLVPAANLLLLFLRKCCCLFTPSCTIAASALNHDAQVCVATPEEAEGGAVLPHSCSLARSGLGVALQPYLQEGTGRLAVAPSGQASDAVLQLAQQEEAAQAEA